jgi:hypothetical protein
LSGLFIIKLSVKINGEKFKIISWRGKKNNKKLSNAAAQTSDKSRATNRRQIIRVRKFTKCRRKRENLRKTLIKYSGK